MNRKPHVWLSHDDWHAIRRRWCNGGITHAELAAEYGVSEIAIKKRSSQEEWRLSGESIIRLWERDERRRERERKRDERFHSAFQEWAENITPEEAELIGNALEGRTLE